MKSIALSVTLINNINICGKIRCLSVLGGSVFIGKDIFGNCLKIIPECLARY